MVDVIEGRLDRSAILSSFEDAVQSYKLVSRQRYHAHRLTDKDMGDQVERRGKLQSSLPGDLSKLSLVRHTLGCISFVLN